MTLQKLKILVEIAGVNQPFVPLVEAMFNPDKIALSRGANWQKTATAGGDAPATNFTHTEAADLTIDLLFDTYEQGIDVRIYTQRVALLLDLQVLHGRPPICQLAWGRFGIFYQGTLQRLNQTFTLFLPDGTPTRATLGCQFQEYRESTARAQAGDLGAAKSIKSYQPKLGESLSSIAGKVYGDESKWRELAEANGIDNPMRLATGAALVVPTLQPKRKRS